MELAAKPKPRPDRLKSTLIRMELSRNMWRSRAILASGSLKPSVRCLWSSRVRSREGNPRNSGLASFENTFGKLGDKLTPELATRERAPAESHAESAEMSQMLRKLLDTKLERASSRDSLDTHFDELFSGLGSLTDVTAEHSRLAAMSESKRLAFTLNQGNTERQILQVFDDLYYHGMISLRFATEVLNDKRVQDATHISRLISRGGTLVNWAGHEKLFYQLSIANKHWKLGNRETARELLHQHFGTIGSDNKQLASALRRFTFNQKRLLSQGILATRSGLEAGLTDYFASTKDSQQMLLVWTIAMKLRRWSVAKSVIEKARSTEPILGALEPLTYYLERGHNLPHHSLTSLLSYIPATPVWQQNLATLILNAVGEKDGLAGETERLLHNVPGLTVSTRLVPEYTVSIEK